MGRGFFSGTLWGLLVAAVALVGATQLTERQDLGLPQPEEAATEVPDATEFAELREESDPVAPEPEAPVLDDEQAALAPVQPRAEEDAAPTLDASPTQAPVPVADAPETPAGPDAPDAPTVATAPDAPLPSRGDVAVPDQPASDAPLTAGTEPPAAPEPDQPVQDAAPEPTTEVAAVAPPATPEPTRETANNALPQIETDPERADTSAITPVLPDATERTEDVIPEVAEVPEAETGEPTRPAQPDPVEDVAAALPGAPVEDAAETEGDDNAMPGQRAGTLAGLGVTEPDAPATPEATEVALVPSDNAGPALQSHRAVFAPPADLPLISLILIVPSELDLPVETLADLPFQASFAVDAAAPTAAETARTLRRAGSEILMIPSLPAGATPADVEQALQSNLAVIPEAIAFMDAPDGGFQSDRMAVAQVVEAAGATGHGLVTFSRGLNTAQQIAQRDGVPAGLVFRDLDGNGQDGGAIRRTLDQAAFRARQEGQVILVARATQPTVAALTEWALGSRAASVALAPVSALIAPSG